MAEIEYLEMGDFEKEVQRKKGKKLQEINIETINALPNKLRAGVKRVYFEWRDRARENDRNILKNEIKRVYNFKKKWRKNKENGKTERLEHDVEGRTIGLYFSSRGHHGRVRRDVTGIKNENRKVIMKNCPNCKEQTALTRNAKRRWCKKCNLFMEKEERDGLFMSKEGVDE